MDECARCGHPLGVGRFCVNCGQARDAAAPDDLRTSTAERPAVSAAPPPPTSPPPSAPPSAAPSATLSATPSATPTGPPPATPPPAYEMPPKVRYPLYADEPALEPTETVDEAPAWETSTAAPASHRRKRGLLPWVLVAAALVLVAAAGGYLLVGGGDDPDEATDPPGRSEPASEPPSPPPASTTTPPSPSDPPTTREPPPGKARDVARTAVATAPSTARPSRDVEGNAVRYDAFNMLDDQADTAWRMSGDGTDSVITFDLEKPTKLGEIGLINGYAKSDRGYDGYAANRRIIAVEWVFADGTVVPQTLGEDRSLQTIEVDVVTDTVELRLVAVTPPARGPSGRDYTAISEVSLVGVPL